MENKTLKENAQEYTPKRTLNVTDLDKVDLSTPLEDRKGTNAEGKDYDYQVMVIEGKEYRVPATVLEEIKKILKIKPDAKFIKATSTGSGLNTEYSVDLLE